MEAINSAPVGATHVNHINGKYFKVELGVITKTYEVKDVDINNGTLIEDCPWIVPIENEPSEVELLRELAATLSSCWLYGGFIPETLNERRMLEIIKGIGFYCTDEDSLIKLVDKHSNIK